MILYHRYIHHINHLLPSKLPVRQKGCVKLALGVKYLSMVARWREGGDCVRRWIMWGISEARGCLAREASRQLGSTRVRVERRTYVGFPWMIFGGEELGVWGRMGGWMWVLDWRCRLVMA